MCSAVGQDLADFPNVSAWIDRCGAREGFEKGKAVEVKAEKGEELLKTMIAMDDGASYLGEMVEYLIETPAGPIKAETPANAPRHAIGEVVAFDLPLEAAAELAKA